jgi:hypothetical protein
MTQVTPKHVIASNVRHLTASLQNLAVSRNFRLKNIYHPELSPHLRHDIGETDCRPTVELPFLEQEVAQATSVDRMLLRSF